MIPSGLGILNIEERAENETRTRRLKDEQPRQDVLVAWRAACMKGKIASWQFSFRLV
jgi:hypothetical protein